MCKILKVKVTSVCGLSILIYNHHLHLIEVRVIYLCQNYSLVLLFIVHQALQLRMQYQFDLHIIGYEARNFKLTPLELSKAGYVIFV